MITVITTNIKYEWKISLMSDKELLKRTLEKLGIEDRIDEVLNKRIKFGPTTTFDENGNLTRLDVSEMGITEVPADTFEGLDHLQELKMFKNEIKELPEEVFDNLNNLIELHLKDNKITDLSTRHFKDLGNLNRLFLAGNPLPEPLAKIFPNKIQVKQFLEKLKTQE